MFQKSQLLLLRHMVSISNLCHTVSPQLREQLGNVWREISHFNSNYDCSHMQANQAINSLENKKFTLATDGSLISL